MNSRLRIFVPDDPSAGAAPATGDAASVRTWGVSGGREMVIPPNLARSQGLVSCRSAGGLFDHLVGKREQGWRNFETDAPGGLQIEHERVTGRLLERQIGRLGALEDAVDQCRRAFKPFRQIRSI